MKYKSTKKSTIRIIVSRSGKYKQKYIGVRLVQIQVQNKVQNKVQKKVQIKVQKKVQIKVQKKTIEKTIAASTRLAMTQTKSTNKSKKEN